MILNDSVKIKINHNKISYYKEKGYTINDDLILDIKISDLTKSSRAIVDAKCFYCNNVRKIQYKLYILNTKDNIKKFACSKKCSSNKTKETNIEKYGVTCSLQQDKIKNKIKDKGFGTQYFIKKSKETLKNKYNVENAGQLKNTFEYYRKKINNLISINKNLFEIKCDKCNESYTISKELYYHRIYRNVNPCVKCNPLHSIQNYNKLENNFIEFIKSIYPNLKERDRIVLEGKELDIYIPDLNLAFEFNGLYWHSELFKDKNYHSNKTKLAQEKGIQLIHIWEDDWTHRQDIVKSIIKNKLDLTENRIYARKCEIREVSSSQANQFLEQNHIQGKINSKYKIGLFFNNELVSLMTFGQLRRALGQSSKQGSYELLRFCNKLNTAVVGGASRLFNYFKEKYQPIEIISYASLDRSNGNMYQKLGFKLQSISKPGYWYIINNKRVHRFKNRKSILIKEGAEKNKSEHQIMLEKFIYRIYDAGNLKYKVDI